jgi:uncharacterized protein (TIGR00251 family)
MPDTTAHLPTFLRIDKHGHVIMDVQLIPNAAKTQVDGLFGERGQLVLKVRLNAPPVDGKANDALIKWLTAQLGIPRTSIEVMRGKTSRRKRLKLSAEAAAKADWHKLISKAL